VLSKNDKNVKANMPTFRIGWTLSKQAKQMSKEVKKEVKQISNCVTSTEVIDPKNIAPDIENTSVIISDKSSE